MNVDKSWKSCKLRGEEVPNQQDYFGVSVVKTNDRGKNNHRVIVFGGRRNYVESFDMNIHEEEECWAEVTKVSPMPICLYNKHNVVAIENESGPGNDVVYVMDSRDDQGDSQNMAYRYNVQTDTWISNVTVPFGAPRMNSPRSLFDSVVIDKKIYAIGGADLIYHDTYDTIEMYDTSTSNEGNRQWTILPMRMATPRAGFCAAVGELNKKIYVFGGCASVLTRRINDTIEVFDVISNERKVLESAKLATWRYNATAVSFKQYIFIIGGHGISGNQLGTIEVFDTETNTMVHADSNGGSIVPPMLHPRGNCSATIVNGNRIVVAGDGDTNAPFMETIVIRDAWAVIRPFVMLRHLFENSRATIHNEEDVQALRGNIDPDNAGGGGGETNLEIQSSYEKEILHAFIQMEKKDVFQYVLSFLYSPNLPLKNLSKKFNKKRKRTESRNTSST